MGFPDIPGYQIEGELGKGGMGVVYRARHIALDRVVALKVIDPKFVRDPEFIKSFALEAKLVARLSHPNIVSVYDFGCSDAQQGIYYLSMQYVQGSTLRDLLFVRRPTLMECASIIHQVADALDFAHREQVVHRDIKPGNILLCPNNKAMVIDFGVAYGTKTNAPDSVWLQAGTRSYMSPEQCKGQMATPRSDQYSLAVTVYEMLTGRLPFTATEPLAVMQQHISDMPPPLRMGRTDITPRIEVAILRALSKIPEMRFPTVGAFARELEAACTEAQAVEGLVRSSSGAAQQSSFPSAPLAGPPVGTRTGAVSLVEGTAVVSAPQTVYRTGYLNAVRGAHEGRGRRSLLTCLLTITLLAGLGAAGYFTYLHQLAATAADKAKVTANKAHAPISPHRSGRSRRRKRDSSRQAEDLNQPPFSPSKSEIPNQAPAATSPSPPGEPDAKPSPSDGGEKAEKQGPSGKTEGEGGASGN